MTEPITAGSAPDGLAELDSRARRGVRSLLVRQVCLQVISFGGSIVLARILGPRQFGLFATVSISVTLIGYFGNFGIAPSFIQRRNDLTEEDLQTGFTLQLALTSLVVAVVWWLAPMISRGYGSGYPDVTWLIRALAFSLFLTTWRSMSALQLERDLRYRVLAWIEVVELATFQLVAIAFALLGVGAMSLVAAVLVRGVLGTALVYCAAPWRVRLRFSWPTAREILSFGVPFQLQQIINTGGVMAPPVIAGVVIGPSAAGYLNWAQNIGSKPITAVESVMRVGFSHFSRIQDRLDEVERRATRYLLMLLLVSGLWFACIATAGKDMVSVVFGPRWVPATTVLVIYAAALNFSVISSVGAVTMNSLGRVRFVTFVMAARSILTVGLSIAFAYQLGYRWVPLAWVIGGSFEAVGVFVGLGASIAVRTFWAVSWVAIAALVAAAVGVVVSHLALVIGVRLSLTLLATVLAYTLVAAFFAPAWLKDAARRYVDQFALRLHRKVVRVGAVGENG